MHAMTLCRLKLSEQTCSERRSNLKVPLAKKASNAKKTLVVVAYMLIIIIIIIIY